MLSSTAKFAMAKLDMGKLLDESIITAIKDAKKSNHNLYRLTDDRNDMVNARLYFPDATHPIINIFISRNAGEYAHRGTSFTVGVMEVLPNELYFSPPKIMNVFAIALIKELNKLGCEIPF